MDAARIAAFVRHFPENGLKLLLEHPGNVHDLLRLLRYRYTNRIDFAHMTVAPDTFVGELTDLNHSVARGSTLIDWRDGSRVDVPDQFLLCSLRQRRPAAPRAHAPGYLAAGWAKLPRLLLAWFFISRARLRELFSLSSSAHWLKQRA